MHEGQTEYIPHHSFMFVTEMPVSSAPTPADWPEADALITRQTLSERSELGCPPKARVRSLRCDQAGRHWFWLLLPEPKWLACRGETRKHRTSR